MAEVFGIVTGAAGLVSLGIQIAQNLKEALDFLDRIKEAPNEVNLLRQELEVLDHVIKDINRHLGDVSSYMTLDICAIEPSLQLCEKCIREFKALAEKLHADLLRNRRIAKIKVALKKDDLDTFRSRLRDAKGTLALAIQCYNM